MTNKERSKYLKAIENIASTLDPFMVGQLQFSVMLVSLFEELEMQGEKPNRKWLQKKLIEAGIKLK